MDEEYPGRAYIREKGNTMSTLARLSVEQYDRMIEAGVFDEPNPRRIELIRGELREMNPIGSGHEEALDYLTIWSAKNLPEDKVRVRIQESIGLPGLDSVPQPDVAWVVQKRYRRGRPIAENVLLIIEVSDSSLKYDRGEKSELYAAAGIRDYWIANVVDEVVEVMREPVDGKFHSIEKYGPGESVRPLLQSQIKLFVDKLFPGDDE